MIGADHGEGASGTIGGGCVILFVCIDVDLVILGANLLSLSGTLGDAGTLGAD